MLLLLVYLGHFWFAACSGLVVVTEEIEGARFNTGISAMTEFINATYKWDKLPWLAIEPFVLLLSPYEELWFRLGHSNSLAYEPFLKADPAYLKESTVVLPV
ncbi:hypothetical protein LOK49_LG09G00259 [Camellia lanceoleosa]|uniref:Uncharacterized protein n=1 Tax=Camellia lanceoleosa TaxID=1840588 RepID=A0ACC0GFU9_9ERIC|nr:hypothetical protein LOK49_LG09G00259 [Camellia lanceoleosa]